MTGQVFIDSSYRYPGVEVTWAGECPLTGGLCFGTESGGILVPLPDATGEAAWLVNDLGDVVNAVAFGDSYCVASTPSRVAIVDLFSGEVLQVLSGGAHDVVSLDGDRFLLSAGIGGMRIVSVRNRQVYVTEHSDQDRPTYFYLATRLANRPNEILVAIAARQSGMLSATISRSSDNVTIAAHLFPESDIVSVVGIPRDEFACGAVGLDADANLLVTRDILKERPTQIRFSEMPGRAYTIRFVGPHLALLTSKAIHLIHDFSSQISRIVAGSCTGTRTAVAPVQASEIYVAFDRYLLVELDNEISALDVKTVFDFEEKPLLTFASDSFSPASGRKLWSPTPGKAEHSIKTIPIAPPPSFSNVELTATCS